MMLPLFDQVEVKPVYLEGMNAMLELYGKTERLTIRGGGIG